MEAGCGVMRLCPSLGRDARGSSGQGDSRLKAQVESKPELVPDKHTFCPKYSQSNGVTEPLLMRRVLTALLGRHGRRTHPLVKQKTSL